MKYTPIVKYFWGVCQVRSLCTTFIYRSVRSTSLPCIRECISVNTTALTMSRAALQTPQWLLWCSVTTATMSRMGRTYRWYADPRRRFLHEQWHGTDHRARSWAWQEAIYAYPRLGCEHEEFPKWCRDKNRGRYLLHQCWHEHLAYHLSHAHIDRWCDDSLVSADISRCAPIRWRPSAATICSDYAVNLGSEDISCSPCSSDKSVTNITGRRFLPLYDLDVSWKIPYIFIATDADFHLHTHPCMQEQRG